MSRRKQARPIRVQENEINTISTEPQGDLPKLQVIMGCNAEPISNSSKGFDEQPNESGKFLRIHYAINC